MALTQERKPGRLFLCLSEDEVSSFWEIALKEKMRFCFFFCLSDEFQNFIFLLFIEEGS